MKPVDPVYCEERVVGDVQRQAYGRVMGVCRRIISKVARVEGLVNYDIYHAIAATLMEDLEHG